MRIKVCGITNLEDAEAADQPRCLGDRAQPSRARARVCVEPDVAAEIGARLKRRCEVAGVFVNATLGEIERAAEAEQLTLLQLHGDEGPAFCAEAARRTGCKVIKALRVRSAADVRAAETYRTDYHLLDAYRPGQPGGTGRELRLGAGRGPRPRRPADPRRAA